MIEFKQTSINREINLEDAMEKRDIIHLDMDAFYAAVEVMDFPELRGAPVIVGGWGDRGVVTAATYEARAFGVRSAMPISRARRLCPDGIFVPGRMSRYQEISKQIFEIFRRFSPLVEPISIDEAFLDVTGCQRLFGTPKFIAGEIKKTVKKELDLTVSAGIAPSKLVAKIASDLEKPDGLTIVEHGRVQEFLDPLPIEKLWGVGKATQKSLSFLGVNTIGDLRQIPESVLSGKFGKHGAHLAAMACGLDNREVSIGRGAKSIGHEETFAKDIINIEKAKQKLLKLAGQVARRLRKNNLEGKTITLKVKYDDFKQVTRSLTIPYFTDNQGEIYQTCCRLLEETETGERPVRLIGIHISHLSGDDEEDAQPSLLPPDEKLESQKKLDSAMDKITDKYGRDTIIPGTLLDD